MRHSDIINPNYLHHSKIRTFTDSPASITPDFADQILSASDTNRIYRATGITAGALVELAPAGSGGGGGSSVTVSPRPYPAASTGGSILFDPNVPAMYVANGDLRWTPINYNLKMTCTSVTNYLSGAAQSSLVLSVLDSNGTAITESFSLANFLSAEPTAAVSKDINRSGLGRYTIFAESSAGISPVMVTILDLSQNAVIPVNSGYDGFEFLEHPLIPLNLQYTLQIYPVP
jgi:hypothetical protein